MTVATIPILHVDDDPNDLLLLEHAWRTVNPGYLVKSAQDGEMAITYLSGQPPFSNRRENPVPTLVLLDLKMPRKSGFEVLSWIRNQPELKRMLVFIFTSSRHQEDVDMAYELGANAYLVKPVGFERLIEEVKILANWLNLNEKPTYKPNGVNYCPTPASRGKLPA